MSPSATVYPTFETEEATGTKTTADGGGDGEADGAKMDAKIAELESAGRRTWRSGGGRADLRAVPKTLLV